VIDRPCGSLPRVLRGPVKDDACDRFRAGIEIIVRIPTRQSASFDHCGQTTAINCR
jgi:hypothetical protein